MIRETASDLLVTDHSVETPHGALFARRWLAGAASGPAILLFHDSLGSVELWRDFPETLAIRTGLPVVAYDRLGFGRSDPNPATLEIDFMVDEGRVNAPVLLAHFGIERFVAFGHSVGGAMAVGAAAQHPDACVAVVTESAQAFVEDRTLQGIAEAKVNFADPAQVARLARYHGDKTRWVLDAWIETWFRPEFADWTMDATLARLRCPVLAIHGDGDEFGSPAHPQIIADRAGVGGRAVLLEGCGHVPHREHPDEVLRLVGAFLRSVGATA